MRKITYTSLLFLLGSTMLWGQQNKFPVSKHGPLKRTTTFDYGNSWYNSSQTYIKFKVWRDGVYRVNSDSLAFFGFDTTGVPVDNLHLIYRGQEVPMYIEKTGSNWSFLEFFGRMNDGKVDELLYRNPANNSVLDPNMIPSNRISMFSDTSAYYLTWNNTPGLRFTPYNNTSYGAITPEDKFVYQSHIDHIPNISSTYNYGGGWQYDPQHILNPDYITGEGYVGDYFGQGGYWTDEDIPTPYAANDGSPTTLYSRTYGKSTYTHVVQISVNGNILMLDSVPLVSMANWTVPIPFNISNPTTVRWDALGSGAADNNHICWEMIEYTRQMNLDANSFVRFNWMKNTDAYLPFANSDITSKGWVYDLTENKRCEGNAGVDTFKVIVPGSPNERDLFAFTDKSIRSPKIEINTSLANLTATNQNAEFIIITSRSLTASANDYATYRDTNTVNPLSAKVVFLDQIYDEFGYGSPTVEATKRFCKYAVDNWVPKPRYFLFWGKGMTEVRDAPDNLCPTWGHPASDYEFLSMFEDTLASAVPIAAVGRVNCNTNVDGWSYLNKVNEYEHSPWEEWMKEGVFIGGGANPGEQGNILAYMQLYFAQFSMAPFGGLAWIYQKMNTGMYTNSPNISFNDRIDDGCGLIQFFGHSSLNINDVDIQEPYLYNNYGRYPLIIAFGCYGGDFTTNYTSFGEKWMVAPGRGSIGYFANSAAGYLYQLGEYGKEFYPVAYGSMLGEAIGDIIKQSHQNYFTTWGLNDIGFRNHALQLNYQGDPAVHIYSPKKPDYEITSNSIYFTPANLSALDTTFQAHIAIKNIALVPTDTVYLSVRQLTPQGNWITYPSIMVPPVLHNDTITLTIHNQIGALMGGLNIFDVFVDSTEIIDEYSEMNNRITIQQMIPSNSPAILFPFNFAVIDSDHVHLAASSQIIQYQPVVNYIFEIDKDYRFLNSTASGIVQGNSVYAQWNVPFTLVDSTVYYWRVRLENVWPPVWGYGSFKYIVNKTGWGQSKPPQFFTDPTNGIEMNQLQQQWEFGERIVELHATVRPQWYATYRIEGGVFESMCPECANSGVMYTPISHKTLEPAIQNILHGDWTYLSMPGAEGELITAINNTPVGDYFLICSSNYPTMASWSDATMAALYHIGCDTTLLGGVQDGQSFIILGRKGMIGSAEMVLNPNLEDSIPLLDLSTKLYSTYPSGKVYAPLIGPSVDWKELIFDWKSVDPFPLEDVRVELKAVRYDNTDSVVYSGVPKGTYSLSGLDADKFPFVRMEGDFVDSIQYTAPQLEHWYVLYDEAPDAAVDPVTYFHVDNDTVMEGQPVTITMAIRNLSDRGMDSMRVKFYARRPDNTTVTINDTTWYAPLPGLDTNLIRFTFTPADSNLNLTGLMAMNIEINPYNDQPEMYHFNNLFTFPLLVNPDIINPLLDVTFNGKHIMDGDYVSPTPEILIQINDENPYLEVADTAYEIWFGAGTSDFNLQRIFIDNNPRMERVRPTLPENKAKLFFRPTGLPNGEYTLKVQGFDHNGNAAGDLMYRITFKVENESAISQVLNYPNPFSSQTRWAYVLTGAVLPDLFQIQVYTISGKMVKVIDLGESGDVKYGYNISEQTWDGRDDFGDLLANGVYIYRVVAKSSGQEMKIRDEGINEFFKNGFGKLYIMR